MVTIDLGNESVLVRNGSLLSEVLIENNKLNENPCSGRGVCGKCKVKVNGESVLSCQYRVNTDIVVELPVVSDVLSETGAIGTGNLSAHMCYALDIGTTTLALALISLDNKEIVSVDTCTNPQVTFGADVISRIDYCREHDFINLQKAVVDGVNKLVNRLGGICCDEMYVSGNTTMLHLLLGKDPTLMGVAPYTPAFLDSQTVRGKEIGLNCVKNVTSLPCISSFVGADLVAGLNFVDKPRNGKYNLLVDLGTNAEIILFSENNVLCTSAAAGPCFEGTNIACGMSATEGAIYSFELKNTVPVFKTISHKSAAGICGTGLVDIISELRNNSIIDETGYMDCGIYNITDNVFLNQKDVRQYQLAKSAVYSAIITLMNRGNIKFSEVEKLYVSGGFSAEINIENAVKTGLLPMDLKEKTEVLNNSSLLGTIKYCFKKNNLSEYLENAQYIDLATNPDFSDLFFGNMEF